ncbi:prenyl protein peptidase [Strigomonas culicis]|nr:prenyl protein peptidase [Strigomonas culicis]|eukprot:EPY24470.1 prenyl protein peptidase [Strigomonas culicis]
MRDRQKINWTQTVKYTTLCMGSTVALFTGPLYEIGVGAVGGVWSDLNSLTFFRDVLLCPFGEELFFRGVLLDVLRHRSATEQILISSALFALSHSHHYFYYAATCFREQAEESVVQRENDKDTVRACYRGAALRLICVHGITFTFGLLSSTYYLHVCKHSVPAISAMHMVCNAVGPPTFEFLQNEYMPKKRRIVAAVLYATGVVLWGYSLKYISSATD